MIYVWITCLISPCLLVFSMWGVVIMWQGAYDVWLWSFVSHQITSTWFSWSKEGMGFFPGTILIPNPSHVRVLDSKHPFFSLQIPAEYWMGVGIRDVGYTIIHPSCGLMLDTWDLHQTLTCMNACMHECMHAFEFSNSEVLLHMPTLALMIISKSHSEARLVHGFARWCKAEVLH